LVVEGGQVYIRVMSKRRVPGVPPKKRNYCHPTWSLAERLAYYSKPEPLTRCHIWHGAADRDGYGCLRYQGRYQHAHRLAWSLKNGPIPKGMVICHRCNVRRCVNPDHLVLGTLADNNADTKAVRLRLADARDATAQTKVLEPGATAIRIFVGGVEMRGRVLIEGISLPAANDQAASLRSTKSSRS
jgi:hypothetical protein